MQPPPEDLAETILFGWDRPTDERSWQAFVRRFSRRELLTTLAPRLTDQEIVALIDQLSGLMKQHLSEKEYHRLFLTNRATIE